MVKLKNIEVLLNCDLRNLNFNINEGFYDSKKPPNLILAKVCDSILGFSIYTFVKLKST